jgi:hypothetical protein
MCPGSRVMVAAAAAAEWRTLYWARVSPQTTEQYTFVDNFHDDHFLNLFTRLGLKPTLLKQDAIN